MSSHPIRERVHQGLGVAGLLSAAWLVAIGCSDPGPKGSVLGGGCDPQDASCGALGESCNAGNECASGSCSGGVCVAQSADCSGPGCLGGGGSAGFVLVGDLPSEDTDAGPEPTCVDLDVDFQRVTPTVMLLIDQSGSMTQPFDNGRNRWKTLQDTLTDPDNSLLEKLETSVRFGMALYTSNGGFGGNPDNPRTCPVLRSVEIALGNFSEMSDLLLDNSPQGDTPTAESVEAITAELQAFAEDGPKSIILATDGDPDTCEDPDANDEPASKDRSVAAVRAAYAAGIATHVISVGNDVTAEHLKALAVAGAGEDPGAEAYTALDTSALVEAFNSIIGSVRTCDFTLQGTVSAENAPRGTVVLDGRTLSYGDPNGWQMPDEHTVRLLGTACELVEADANGISMKFPCDAIQIIPR